MRAVLLFIQLFLSTMAIAQQSDSIYVNQFVKNSFTKFGVRNALVTISDSSGNMIDTVRTAPGNGSHDAQIWQLKVARRAAKFIIKVEHPDYKTGEMMVEMKHPARLNSYRFPDMLLKRNYDEKGINLNEVTVRATRVKLCYKGDTIEVDARAFKLSEGSMLESLVKNIPGCELRDNGDIYMNGRKVDYLTLNGKDFFKGNNRIMLDNLPYYTVDKLQFFNQQSEISQLIGKNAERPDYVMNVKLKQEYNTGYLGNVEIGGGTHERWMGRGFALRFTDNSRLSLYGKANNINDTRSPGENGSWEQQNNPIGDTKTYNAGGELLVDDKQGRYKEVANASLIWDKAVDKQRTATQQFIQQGDMFGYNTNASTDQSFSLSANNRLTFKRIGLISDSHYEYSNYDKDAQLRSVQLSGQAENGVDQVIDSIFSTSQSSTLKKLMINNVRDIAVSSGHKWKADQKFDYHKSLPWGDDLMLTATGSWNNTKNDVNSHYGLKYANGEQPDDNRDQITKSFSHFYKIDFAINYAFHFLTGWHLNLSYTHNKQYSKEHRDLYRLDWDESYNPDETLPSMSDYMRLIDGYNSPHYTNSQHEEIFSTSLHRHDYDSKRGRYFSFTTRLNAHYSTQNGVYARAEKTVRPKDCRWLFKPSVDVECQTRNWHDTYQFHYNTDMHPLNLAQVADLTDTSNPLAVQKGNSNLRPSTTHNVSAMFNTRFGTHGQFIIFRSNASIMHNLVAMNSIYDHSTGAYTYIPVNVNGNWISNSSIGARRALTKRRDLNIEGNTSYSYLHNVDMKDNRTSTVKQHVLSQNIQLEYKHAQFTLTLLGNVAWHGVRQASVENINSTDFNYGAHLQANLPQMFHLSTDLRMYSRRGYNDKAMCTDNLLWNAQIDRTFFKGRLLVVCKAFDLLHQISSTHVTINSQGRTETWQLSLPSYIMLNVQYRFNHNPKKK